MDNGGLCDDNDYPYTSGSGVRGWCRAHKCKVVKNSAPESYTDVKEGSKWSLMGALSKQPVAVAIEADESSFQGCRPMNLVVF